MGWLYTNKPKSTTVKDFFIEQLNYTNEDGSYGKVIDVKTKIKTAYIAYEIKRSSGETEVIALVCLINYDRTNYNNFGYKTMDESMLPYYYDCPESILKLLTPTDDPNSIDWRIRCRKQLADKKAIKFNVGDVITFERMFKFAGYGQDYKFTCLNPRNLYFTANNLEAVVRLTKDNLLNNPHTLKRYGE